METVFVYGTLKRGGRWHHLLSTAEPLGAARTSVPHPLLVDDFPYVLDEPGSGEIVEGELYHVDYPTLARLDQLEDHPREYERRVRTFQRKSGEPCDAWIYFVRSPEIVARIKARGLSPIASFDVTSR